MSNGNNSDDIDPTEYTRRAFAPPTPRQFEQQARARAKGGLSPSGIREYNRRVKEGLRQLKKSGEYDEFSEKELKQAIEESIIQHEREKLGLKDVRTGERIISDKNRRIETFQSGRVIVTDLKTGEKRYYTSEQAKALRPGEVHIPEEGIVSYDVQRRETGVQPFMGGGMVEQLDTVQPTTDAFAPSGALAYTEQRIDRPTPIGRFGGILIETDLKGQGTFVPPSVVEEVIPATREVDKPRIERLKRMDFLGRSITTDEEIWEKQLEKDFPLRSKPIVGYRKVLRLLEGKVEDVPVLKDLSKPVLSVGRGLVDLYESVVLPERTIEAAYKVFEKPKEFVEAVSEESAKRGEISTFIRLATPLVAIDVAPIFLGKLPSKVNIQKFGTMSKNVMKKAGRLFSEPLKGKTGSLESIFGRKRGGRYVLRTISATEEEMVWIPDNILEGDISKAAKFFYERKSREYVWTKSRAEELYRGRKWQEWEKSQAKKTPGWKERGRISEGQPYDPWGVKDQWIPKEKTIVKKVMKELSKVKPEFKIRTPTAVGIATTLRQIDQPKLYIEPMLKEKIKRKTRVLSIPKLITKPKLTTRIRTKQMVKQKTVPKLKQIPILKLKQLRIPKVRVYPDLAPQPRPTRGYRDVPRPPKAPKRLIPGFDIDLKFKRPDYQTRKKKKPRLELLTKYKPSLIATELKIFGKKPKLLTGLKIRPIPM